jgi:rubrerythrin
MSTPVEKALARAIVVEIDAHDFYHSLAEKIANSEARQKLQNLAKAERGHRLLLEKRYQLLLGKPFDPGQIQGSGELMQALERANLHQRSDVLEVVEEAIKAEERAADYYKKQGEASSSDPEAKALYLELSQEENRHRTVLKREYDALVASLYCFETVTSRPLED